MRSRVASCFEGAELSRRRTYSRFHSFCVRPAARDGEPWPDPPRFRRNFTIYDQEDQIALIKPPIAIWGSTKSS